MTLHYSRPAATLAVLCLAGAGLANTAMAQDADPEQQQVRVQVRERAPLAVTMRIIEDPEAVDAKAVTRRISLPPAAEAPGPGERADDAAAREHGNAPGKSEQAMERGREFGEAVSERAREMREKASENREEFGRSRAEEMRPERPERPEPPRPPRP